MAQPTTSSASSNIHISTHPLVAARLTQLRLHDLPPRDFRDGVKAIAGMMIYEASRGLESVDVPDLQSPIATFTGKTIGPRVGLAPILRAGIGMTEAALEIFPEATVLHLGIYRDKVSLQAVEYYSKIPSELTADICYIIDPLIATGGTAIAALTMLRDWGLREDQIKIISVLGSRAGVNHVAEEYPGVEIWIGAIDEDLTDKGYISPGLGDAGNRLFSTHR